MTDSFTTEALDFDTEALDPKTVSQAELDRYTPRTVEDLNERLPQYEFIELIAVGGMGAVYKARQPKLDRLVAIKLLPKMPDDKYGFGERFEREAKAMAKLSHPHIVPIFDFGETEGGQAYFVMEFVEGADLHQLIHGGQLTIAHFFGWIPQICSAIQYAHNQDVVHRDIKPANILINREGNVKMADFGLAKLTGAKPAWDPDSENPEPEQINDAVSMGTPGYAAPEQFDKDSQVDARADIYALGVVMYQFLTGKMPVGAFPMPSEINPHIDIRLDEVVMRAMQEDADDRFQSITEISERLTTIHATEHDLPEEEPEVDPTLTPSGKRLITGRVQTVSKKVTLATGRVATVTGKVSIPVDRVAAAGSTPSLITGKVATVPAGSASSRPHSSQLRQAIAERDARPVPPIAVIAVIATIIVVVYLVAFSGNKTVRDTTPPSTEEISTSMVSNNAVVEKPVADPNTEAGQQIGNITATCDELYLSLVKTPYEESITLLNSVYLKTLEQEKAEASEKEDSKLEAALQAEIDWMAENGAPRLEMSTELPEKILTMRKNYLRKLESYAGEKIANNREFENRLDSLLANLQQEFVDTQKPESAREVKMYRLQRTQWLASNEQITRTNP